MNTLLEIATALALMYGAWSIFALLVLVPLALIFRARDNRRIERAYWADWDEYMKKSTSGPPQ